MYLSSTTLLIVLFQNTCPHSRVQEQFLLDLEEEGVSEDSQISTIKFHVFYCYFTRQKKKLIAPS